MRFSVTNVSRLVVWAIAITVLSSSVLAQSSPQKLDPDTAKRVEDMLRKGYLEVQKNYFDKDYKGVNWDADYAQYDAKMKQITSLAQGLSLVAGLMMTLADSHPFFMPPSRPVRLEYGFRLLMIGDRAFVVHVRPDTDAEKKVHVGDEIVAYNRFVVNRDSLWKMKYYYGQLSPLQISDLVLKSPDGQQRDEKIETKVQELSGNLNYMTNEGWKIIREQENLQHQFRERHVEMDDVMIWKMPVFNIDDYQVDHLFGIARKHKALILDLRDNPGGAAPTLQRMVGNIFDHDVKIADRVGRSTELKPMVAQSRAKDVYAGKIVVLIDSGSASAAELLARVMQLENRGTVVGDRSAGAVMEARRYNESEAGNTGSIFYGFSITEANLIMKDGKSLEHTGVVPDEIILPTGRDLADGKDPALVRAAQLVGLTLDPIQAGKLFPFEWLPIGTELAASGE
ncbi:MAG: S41 family peptidase [Candidatus Acidiferrum sp.]